MEFETKFYGKLNDKEYTDVNSFMTDLFNCNENESEFCSSMQKLLKNIMDFNCNMHSQCKGLFYNENDDIEPIEEDKQSFINEDNDVEKLLDEEEEDEVTNVHTLPEYYSNDIEYLVPEIDKFIIKYSDDKMFNDAASEYKNSLDKRISYLHENIKNASIEELDVLEKALTKADTDTVQAMIDSKYAEVIFQLTHDYNKTNMVRDINEDNNEMICKNWAILYYRLLKYFGIKSKIDRSKSHYKVKMHYNDVDYSIDATGYGGNAYFYSLSDTTRIKCNLKIERFLVTGRRDKIDISKFSKAVEELNIAINNVYKRQNRSVKKEE